MPRIKCHYTDCVFIDEGICSAAAVEVDPDEGCKTYTPTDETAASADEWDDDDEAGEWDDEESDEDDDDWLDEEDEF